MFPRNSPPRPCPTNREHTESIYQMQCGSSHIVACVFTTCSIFLAFFVISYMLSQSTEPPEKFHPYGQAPDLYQGLYMYLYVHFRFSVLFPPLAATSDGHDRWMISGCTLHAQYLYIHVHTCAQCTYAYGLYVHAALLSVVGHVLRMYVPGILWMYIHTSCMYSICSCATRAQGGRASRALPSHVCIKDICAEYLRYVWMN